jgi:hypothetical protein
LFGSLLVARGFRRVEGALFLVVELPDGSPGTIRADATDVLDEGPVEPSAAVLDLEGLRSLRRLVTGLRAAARRPGVRGDGK